MANYSAFESTGASSSSSSTPWTTHFDDPEEIHQDGKVMLKLSDRKPIFIVPDTFRDKVYINIREYFFLKKSTKVADSSAEEEEEEEEKRTNPFLIASKKGVCLTEDEFSDFVEKLQRVKSLVKRLKKKLRKDSDKRRRQGKQDSDRQKSR